MISDLLLFFKLVIGHALSDFALQNPDMAKYKNRNNKPDNVPTGQKTTPCWFYFMTAHALIHGGTVWVITGLPLMGLAETVNHWLIDYLKCENVTNPHIDQALHIGCKIVYIVCINILN